MMHRHNNTSGACQENPSAPTLKVLERESLTLPFLTPPEAFVKDLLNSYQLSRRPLRSEEISSGPVNE
jgi:hypothetical protein